MKKTIKLKSDKEASRLYGNLDERLKYAESEFHVKTSARNSGLVLEGDGKNVSKAAQFFQKILNQIRSGVEESEAGLRNSSPRESDERGLHFVHKGKLIKPKSRNQETLIKLVERFDVVFAIGPAGTGKTYLAMALAVDALKKKRVERIVLTRPAVEAGESLGFLPGDMLAKVNPYLRPLYDALHDMMDSDEVTRCMHKGMIEVAPLAYMRGRTLNDSFVILDEAQNCTHQQLKMFLTRLGYSSKMMINGDITQIDLPAGKRSGLVESQKILRSVQGIGFVELDESDVVRHKLVQAIITAYERHEKTIRRKNHGDTFVSPPSAQN